MSQRIQKVNSLIKRTFGEILQEEAERPAEVLITVSSVETKPNLRSTTVWLYILPFERGEEVLEDLRKQLYELQGLLNKRLQMRPLPRIVLQLDHGAEHAETIDRIIREDPGGT